jgi:protein-S-isoprenylcysteine O-methyltransferase Ste14
VRAPYQQGGVGVAFWVLVGVFAVGEYAVRVRSRLNRSGTRTDRWTLGVVAAAVVVGMGGGLAVARWEAAGMGAADWPVFGVGLALMAAGIAVRQWAIRTLGRFFTVDVRVHPDQQVVTSGPYRWVRHPAYTGMIVFLLGVGLALTNWASLALLATIPTAALVVRIHAEERALLDGLGEPYRRYAATHRRLVPGVW